MDSSVDFAKFDHSKNKVTVPVKSPAGELDRLRTLYELSMTLSGDPIDVFSRVARMIGELLDVKVVCLSQIRGDELHFLSVYVQGKMYTNAGRCPLSITPCATVEKSKDYRVYHRVIEQFPEASFLKEHNAYSYCGFPALNNQGKVVAVTCLLDDRPHDFSDQDHEILRIFAQRIGMEIERQHHIDLQTKAQEEIRLHRDRLEELVTERTAQLKSAQEELISKERLATLGQLTATVSHELRNPLGTIRSSAYSINSKLHGKNLGVDKALDRIQRNVSRCDRIISELLDYTRIRDLELETLEFDAWLIDLLKELEHPEEVKLKTKLAARCNVTFDPGLMRRVIINVYDNACQAITAKLQQSHTEQEGLMTLATSKDSNSLRLDISDTGVGIDDKIKQNIFEPLFSTKNFGVGLGLTVVLQIVEQHKGHIDIHSKPGQGTTISITVPLENH